MRKQINKGLLLVLAPLLILLFFIGWSLVWSESKGKVKRP